MTEPLPVLGWREWIALPELGIERIKAKVDTGARTSALHAFRVAEIRLRGGPGVAFSVHPLQKNQTDVVHCEAPVLDRRVVRDSGGHEELRYVIETRLRLSRWAYDIEVTLTDRETMGFRFLLGRTAMRDRFLVDPGKSYVQGGKDESSEG